MTDVLQNLVNGVTLGSLFALYALGVALVFGIMRLMNFAHASLLMAGAYTMVEGDDLPLVWRVLLTIAVCVTLAVLLELVVFRWIRDASPATLLVASFGVLLMLAAVAEAFFGVLARGTDVHPWLRGSWTFGDVFVPKLNVVTVVVTAVLLLGLTLFLTKTPIGLQMRAAAEDFPTARTMGIRANRVIGLAFALSGLLAAAASILLVAQTGSATPTFGTNAVLFGLVAAVVGGLGSLSGAVIGGMVLGAASQTLQATLPVEIRPYRDTFLFLAVFLLLVIRPGGIVSKGTGARV